MSHSVTVNFNGSSFGVQFKPSWNISRLKREIARKKSVNPSAIKIIFAGQELPDNMTLEVLIIALFKYLMKFNCRISLILNNVKCVVNVC